jgi:hypothetical protein
MPIQERNKLKGWFETGDYPTQQQFWDLIDSFFHRLDDTIGIDNITGLRALLNGKAEYEQLQSHFTDKANPHAVTKAQIGLGNLPNALSDAIDLNDSGTLATSAAVYQLNSKITNSSIEERLLTENGSYTVWMNDLLEKIVVIPSSSITLSIGNTAADKDILEDLPLQAGVANVIQLDVFAYATNRQLFFNGISGNTTIRFYKK